MACAALGCGAPPEAGDGTTGGDGTTAFTVRDSAGVVIAENVGEPPVTIIVDGPPLLDIGVADGDPARQLSGVVGAVLTSAGTLVIADGATGELRFFDEAGDFIRSVGREGEGPGEFRALGALFPRGDSLVAHDTRSWRFSIFDAGGELVRTTPLGATYMGLLRDGTLISYAVTTRGMPAPGTVSRSRGILLRHPPAGGAPDTIAHFGMNEHYVHTEIPGFSERMFGRDTQTVFRGGRIVIADNDTYELRELTADGSVVRLIRRDRPNRVVTAEDAAAYIDAAMARYGDDPRREISERSLRDQPVPATMPAFGRSGLIRSRLPTVIWDSRGFLWVLDYVAFPDERPSWSVFDHEGRLVALVTLPLGVDLLYAGEESLVGLWRDALDVEHVQVFAFGPVDR